MRTQPTPTQRIHTCPGITATLLTQVCAHNTFYNLIYNNQPYRCIDRTVFCTLQCTVHTSYPASAIVVLAPNML